jgi:hypothetical protein
LFPAQKAVTLIVIAIGLAVAHPAAAQSSPTWDVFGGYAYLHDSTQDLNLPAGWSASTSRHLNRWLSVVVDAGGHYRTLPLVGGEVSLSLHSVMAGGRVSLAVGNFVEFVQIVFGPVRSRGTAFGLTSSDTARRRTGRHRTRCSAEGQTRRAHRIRHARSADGS